MGRRASQLTLPKNTIEEILHRFGQCETKLKDMSEGAKTPRKAKWRTDRYKAQGLDPNRCVHLATHEVEGEKLCAKHAGAKALKILMEE